MKQLMTGLLVSALLLVGGVPWAMAVQIERVNPSGTVTKYGLVTTDSVVTGVTNNTTSVAIKMAVGAKSFFGQVAGTGAITQTQAIYGDIDNDAANGVLLCTITLSGTTKTQDACPVIIANFPYVYVVTTNTTGTGATGDVYAIY